MNIHFCLLFNNQFNVSIYQLDECIGHFLCSLCIYEDRYKQGNYSSIYCQSPKGCIKPVECVCCASQESRMDGKLEPFNTSVYTR